MDILAFAFVTLAILAALVAVDVLAIALGADSRDGIGDDHARRGTIAR